MRDAFKFFESYSEATVKLISWLCLQPNQPTNPKRKRGLRELGGKQLILKGLILAQNERWRRGLGMQVEREPLGNWRGKWRKGQ